MQDSTQYRKLGKPIGGTFIMLALLFLLLGESPGLAKCWLHSARNLGLWSVSKITVTDSL